MAPLLHTNEKIRSTKIDNFKTPTEYVAKMRSLFDERKRLNHEINDDEKICFLIEGLSSRYRELVDRFKNYTTEQWNLVSVGNAIITFTIPSAKPAAAANMTVHRNGTNFKRRREGQGVQNYDNMKTKNQEKQRCPHCSMRNHKPENCWFKYPEKRPPKRPKIEEAYSTSTNPKPKESALRTRITPRSYEDNDLPDNIWLVDSGATKHFCRERTAFKTLSPYVTTIEVANGEILESEGIGVVDLPLIQWNGKTTLLRLKNVVYAPQLKANLLSADQLNRENMGISLLPINSEIIDLQNKKRLGTISRLNNLYIVNTGHMRSGGQHSYLVEAKPKSIRLWHRRLGHLGLKNVQKLENLVRGMKISENQKDDHDFVCGHCQKARHLKTSLQISRHQKLCSL